MTTPIRVVVWATSASHASDIAARLDEDPIAVVAIVTAMSHQDRAAHAADLLIVADEGALDALEDSSSRAPSRGPALLAISDAPETADRLARQHARAWGVVGRGASAPQLRAAVVAVVAGLVVTSLPDKARLVAEPVDAHDDWPGVGTLTPREIEVLEALALGLSNRAVASRLGLSENTVKFHVASIYGKLGVSTRTQAVRRGLRRGLIRI